MLKLISESETLWNLCSTFVLVVGLPVLKMVWSPKNEKYSKHFSSDCKESKRISYVFFTLYRSSCVQGKEGLDLRLRNKVSIQSSPSESFDHRSVEDLPSCNQTFFARFLAFLVTTGSKLCCFVTQGVPRWVLHRLRWRWSLCFFWHCVFFISMEIGESNIGWWP